ncbi:hypothetical protein C8R44DRAFT_826171 [Mycena epipterygia]|nr:hypothetical protein C8R44DRAFT_826171 [Mycena epipterygia]
MLSLSFLLSLLFSFPATPLLRPFFAGSSDGAPSHLPSIIVISSHFLLYHFISCTPSLRPRRQMCGSGPRTCLAMCPTCRGCPQRRCTTPGVILRAGERRCGLGVTLSHADSTNTERECNGGLRIYSRLASQ